MSNRLEDQLVRFGVFKEERAHRFAAMLLKKVVLP